MTTSKLYDDLNRLTEISSAPGATGLLPVTYNYAYNAANQRTQNTFSDGSHWVYQYDSLGQVTNGARFWSDGTHVAGADYQYQFDTIGNRTHTQTGGTTNGLSLRVANYTNNSLNQITSRDVPGTNDVIGAALVGDTVTVNGVTVVDRKAEFFHSTVGQNNQTGPVWQGVTATGAGGSVSGSIYVAQEPETFLYDADGNLSSDGRWNYTWDAENRLVGMTVNTSAGPNFQLAFAYDAQGRRIQKTVNSNNAVCVTINYLYDGWNLIDEVTAGGAPLRSYVWGTDLSGTPQGAGGVGGLLLVTYHSSLITNAFVSYDGNGNVSALVNAGDGTLLAGYEYGPFGEPIRLTGPLARNIPFRFSTKYQDDESDFVYYGYRYYKASTGTWPNRDPLQERGGLNLFAFVNNRAVIDYDYLGLSCEQQQASGTITYCPGGDDINGEDVVVTATYNACCDQFDPSLGAPTWTHTSWSGGFGITIGPITAGKKMLEYENMGTHLEDCGNYMCGKCMVQKWKVKLVSEFGIDIPIQGPVGVGGPSWTITLGSTDITLKDCCCAVVTF